MILKRAKGATECPHTDFQDSFREGIMLSNPSASQLKTCKIFSFGTNQYCITFWCCLAIPCIPNQSWLNARHK